MWGIMGLLALLLVARGLVNLRHHGPSSLHHAVQISRECGVPYVSLPHADEATIPDGARVELGGNAGTVTILDPMSSEQGRAQHEG